MPVDSSVLTTLEATTAIENFNSTENPLVNGGSGRTWNTPVNSGEGAITTNGTQAAAPAVATDYTGYITDLTYNNAVGAMVSISSKNASDDGLIGLYVGLESAGLGSGTPDGYRGEIRIRSTGDEWRIQRIDDGVATVLSSGTIQEVTAGDKMAVIRTSGNAIELWWKTGGSWSFVVSASSSTYTAGGKVGIHITDISTNGNTGDDLKAMNLTVNTDRTPSVGSAVLTGIAPSRVVGTILTPVTP